MKKNIAIFEPNLNIGGIEKSLINLLKKIDYDKYNIDLYLLSKGNIIFIIINFFQKINQTFFNTTYI